MLKYTRHHIKMFYHRSPTLITYQHLTTFGTPRPIRSAVWRRLWNRSRFTEWYQHLTHQYHFHISTSFSLWNEMHVWRHTSRHRKSIMKINLQSEKSMQHYHIILMHESFTSLGFLLERKTFTYSLQSNHKRKGPPILDNLRRDVNDFCRSKTALNNSFINNSGVEGVSFFLITVSWGSGTMPSAVT